MRFGKFSKYSLKYVKKALVVKGQDDTGHYDDVVMAGFPHYHFKVVPWGKRQTYRGQNGVPQGTSL